MLKRYLAALAFELADGAMYRAEHARLLREFIYWRGRSRWWSDVEHALLGLGKFSDLRAARTKAVKDRARRLQQPFIGLPLMVVGL